MFCNINVIVGKVIEVIELYHFFLFIELQIDKRKYNSSVNVFVG